MPLVSARGLLSDHDFRAFEGAGLYRTARRQRCLPARQGVEKLALTSFQRETCQRLALNRTDESESYVADDAALNAVLGQPRVSRDVDIFYDSVEVVYRTSTADRHLLLDAGSALDILIERPGFVEATVRRGREQVGIQWALDSAYRFFPLVEHVDFGLTLHPFDLATNKVLALVGRGTGST